MAAWSWSPRSPKHLLGVVTSLHALTILLPGQCERCAPRVLRVSCRSSSMDRRGRLERIFPFTSNFNPFSSYLQNCRRLPLRRVLALKYLPSCPCLRRIAPASMYPVLSLRFPWADLEVSALVVLPCCVSVCLDAMAVDCLNHRGGRNRVEFIDFRQAGKKCERKVPCRLPVNAVLRLADLHRREVRDAVGLNGGGGLPYFR